MNEAQITLTLTQILTFAFSFITLITTFLATRFIKGYDDKLKELNVRVDELEDENNKLKLEAEQRATLFVEKLGHTHNKLTEIKTLLLNGKQKASNR